MRLRFSFLLFFLTFMAWGGIVPSTAVAVSPANILIKTVPENPAPGENVNVSLGSYASNLDIILISWSLNGKIISSGVGKKSVYFTAPEAGNEIKVMATVALPDGTIEKIVTIRPNVMTLLWQANDSFVPPFYKGKALPSADTSVKVVAIPEIKNGEQTVNAKNLTYVWKKDYTNDPSASGYGRNFYVYVNDYLEDINTISVTASTTDQKDSSQASLNIKTYQPKIIFYKNDPALGSLWENALTDGYKIEGSAVIEASPYYISPNDLRIPSLSWSWSINDFYVDVGAMRKNLLPVMAQAGTTGTSKIKLEITNKYKIFESAVGGLRVEF